MDIGSRWTVRERRRRSQRTRTEHKGDACAVPVGEATLQHRYLDWRGAHRVTGRCAFSRLERLVPPKHVDLRTKLARSARALRRRRFGFQSICGARPHAAESSHGLETVVVSI